ncbi:MAG: uL30 family ribosomal protein [Candidatus Diapherotrites archaeon]|nr:uL30 family ribosomal protein [Candidatus Diapherotrites archaeon]
MYAVIRIRGTVNVTPRLKKALEYMNLRRVNNLSIWSEEQQGKGTVVKVKDYTAYGKINDETLKELIAKKAKPAVIGSKIDAKKVFEEIKKGKTPRQAGIKNLFRLSPPRGGFEREGVKASYKVGGALGDRGEKINELILRMI